MSKYKNKELSSTLDIKRAHNTLNFFFGGLSKRVGNLEFALKYVLSTRNNGSFNSLKRKISVLTYEGEVDPYYEYLGYLKHGTFGRKP